MRKMLEDTLAEMGIKPNMTAFDYIFDSAIYVRENGRTPIMSLYRIVAKKYNVSTSSVARSMRYALMKADENACRERKIVNDTNAEFIYTLARYIKKMEEEDK